MSPPPALSDLSDHDLAAQARKGQEAAWTELVRRYQPTIFKVIFRMVHKRELAEDLTQDTLYKIFKSLDSARSESKFSSWVLQIAGNTAIDHFRLEEPEPEPLDNTPDSSMPGKVRGLAMATPTPDPTPLDEETRTKIRKAVKGLKGYQRTCVEMHFLEDRSYDDIAQLLGIPVGSVATYLTRARKELKRILGMDLS